MMSMLSQHIAGLHSRYALFNPPRYLSSTISKGGGDVIYAIDSVLELKLSQQNAGVDDGSSSDVGDATAWVLNESVAKELLGLPWFGGDTGKSVLRVSIRTTLYGHHSLSACLFDPDITSSYLTGLQPRTLPNLSMSILLLTRTGFLLHLQ
jgi:hypothetical protein